MLPKRKNIIIVSGVFLFILIPLINRSITSRVKMFHWDEQSGTHEKSISHKDDDSSFSYWDEKNPLTADDPAQFNIIHQEKASIPRTQLQWDFSTKKSLWESDSLSDVRNLEDFERIKKKPEEFQNQLQRIQKRIVEFEGKRSENPNNPQIEQKLRTLYILKATLTALESEIIK